MAYAEPLREPVLKRDYGDSVRRHSRASDARWRRWLRSLLRLVRSALGLSLLALLLPIAAGAAVRALEPPDTSSPRDTLRSFLALTDEVGARLLEYRRSPSPSAERALFLAVDSIDDLLDLSQIPPAARSQAAVEAFFLLWEVMARVQLPDLEKIPGDDEAAKLSRWRIPHTRIVIARIAEGPRAGEFLISSDTVGEARALYEAARDLPHLRPMPAEDTYRTGQRLTGWMIPLAWAEALPDWADTSVLGMLVWKWFAAVLLFALALAATLLVASWARRGSWDGSLSSLARRLVAPFALVVLAYVVRRAVAFQIIATGAAGEGFLSAIEIAQGVALVWVVWITMSWVAEAIIASPRIDDSSLGAHMIRLAARAVGAAAIVVLVFQVGNDLGVPLYGLVAGAGVGGLAIALAARSTLENFMGTLNLFADRPVKVGDFCRYGADPSPGYLRIGTVEEIGLRSTRIRGIDRTLTTIPNAEFSNLHIVNLTQRDRMLLHKTFGLRYETTADQLRFVLAELRKLLLAHPRVAPDPARVRLTGFGQSSIDLEVFAYVNTPDWGEFLAVQEDILLRVMDIVRQAGTSMAFPSRTLYHARDHGFDRERQQASEQQVREWAAAQALPFPEFPDDLRRKILNTLDYPPRGSPGSKRE
jgi:MscS family membrane protein